MILILIGIGIDKEPPTSSSRVVFFEKTLRMPPRIGHAADEMKRHCITLAAVATALLTLTHSPMKAEQDTSMLSIGWAQVDITPLREASLAGMTAVRVASEVIDPLTATALAIEAPYQESGGEGVIMISCDLRSIRSPVIDGVRAVLRASRPDIDPSRLIINATHTHNAPPLGRFGLPLEAMDEPEYQEFVIPLLAAVAAEAWDNRQPGGISYGLTHAVIGHNRLMAYDSGRSAMGTSRIHTPEFSHVEGFEDPALQLIYTWTPEGELTGIVVNIASPSQTTQSRSVISADYWHEVREELRHRCGDSLFILPQLSAAGDQMSRQTIYARAESRMQRLEGISYRQQIANRVADAVESIHDLMRANIEWSPRLAHHSEVVPLTRRIINESDVARAQRDFVTEEQRYSSGMEALAANPELLDDATWRRDTTRAWRNMRRATAVQERFEAQQIEPHEPTELHVIRLGDIAIATNPFELYLDFGIQIKARSPAIQTFLVQLAGGTMGYVPTERSVRGGAYGATPASTRVGPEGGRDLVNWTVETITRLQQE